MKKTWTVKWTVKFNSLKPLAPLAAGGLATQLASGQCVPPPAGLIGWWPGNGNANDICGTNNGVLVGSASAGANGLVAQGFQFGQFGYVNLAPIQMSSFTVEFWIKANTLPTVYYCWDAPCYFLVTGELCGTVDDWSTQLIADGRIEFLLGDRVANTDAVFHSARSLSLNTFHHVAVTRSTSDGIVKIYIDGALDGSFNAPHNRPVGGDAPTCFSAPNTIGIGNWEHPVSLGVPSFDGVIDEVAIYDRSLSSGEIASIFNAGACGKVKGLIITRQPQSQLGYWGKSASFSVSVTNGVPPYGYQWQKDGVAIHAATNSLLVRANLQATNAGVYTVAVSDAVTNLISQPATLTVNPAGVSLALYAGVTIDGVVDQTYGIQSTLNLSNTNSWVGRTNITLTTPTYLWYDSQPATLPQTYYRVVPGPISVP